MSEQAMILSQIPLKDLMAAIRTIVKEEYENKSSTPAAEKEYLSRKEMAGKLGISLPTLHTYTKQGLIPSYRISGRVLYRHSDIAASLTKVKQYRNG